MLPVRRSRDLLTLMSTKASHTNIWERLREGNKDALLSLYNEHYIGLMNYGIKLTNKRDITRDAITQVLLRLWDNRSRLPEVNNVRSYLLTTLRRELMAEVKMENIRHTRNQEACQLIPTEEKSYEELIIQWQHNNELRLKLAKAFNTLTAREKELLQLKFFEDLDYKEIAERCNISKRTAYNIIHAALKSLRTILIATPRENSIPDHILLSCIFLILIQA
ncbi:MAG: hypothetical protein BGP14_06660 [Sphingobacteriales bacterium 44-15]|nr:MAG: hypothetical protein BGP14_06660 [Sphingobacteriales bacterium 44-15]